MKTTIVFFLLSITAGCATIQPSEPTTTAEVLAKTMPSDWRQPNPGNLLVMELDAGQVVFELAPAFAPAHIENLRKLVAQRYFDGLAVIRSQDNYVVQWGDPEWESAERSRSLGKAESTLTPEFYRASKGLQMTSVESRDSYADRVGFVNGFPVASDGSRTWLTHCYGMLGVGRDVAPDSGNASGLYVVTGHAPRHLDRNVTLIGRALSGLSLLSSLPRGTGPLGFYEDPAEHVPIRSIRFASELQNPPTFNIMRTTSASFQDYVASRTHRNESWFADPVGKIELCNLRVPTRP